jgi:hypothetical protein
LSRLLPGAPRQTPGLFTGPRPVRRRRRAGPRRPPALGPSAALTRRSRGQAGPWSAEAAATAAGEVTKWGGHRGGDRPGRGRRRRGGAGLRPGPRLSAPSRLRSSGRWSGRQRAGPGGGGGRAEDSSLSRPTCQASPLPPPLLPAGELQRSEHPQAADPAGAETTAL